MTVRNRKCGTCKKVFATHEQGSCNISPKCPDCKLEENRVLKENRRLIGENKTLVEVNDELRAELRSENRRFREVEAKLICKIDSLSFGGGVKN